MKTAQFVLFISVLSSMVFREVLTEESGTHTTIFLTDQLLKSLFARDTVNGKVYRQGSLALLIYRFAQHVVDNELDDAWIWFEVIVEILTRYDENEKRKEREMQQRETREMLERGMEERRQLEQRYMYGWF